MTVLLIFQSGAWLGVDRLFPRLPGVRLWAVASFIGGLGSFVLCTKGFIPADKAIMYGSVLQILGFLVAWNGIRQFFERKPLWWLCALVMGITVGILFFSSWALYPEETHKIVIVSIEALIALACVNEMVRRPSTLHMTTSISALAMLIHAAVLGSTVLIIIFAMRPHSDRVMALESALLLIAVIATIFWSFGLLSMVVSKLQRRLVHLAATDELTGVANRHAFVEAANRERSRANRDGTSPSLLIIDVDNFKLINDAHGHVGGDRMLANISRSISACLRPYDLLARIGGDEFCILMPATSYSHAVAAAERIRKVVEARTLTWNGQIFNTTVSIGVVTWTAEMGGLLQIMSLADAALYDGKRTGRNRVVAVQADVFHPAAAEHHPEQACEMPTLKIEEPVTKRQSPLGSTP